MSSKYLSLPVVVSSDVDEAEGGVCEDDVGQREVNSEWRNKDDS